LCNAESIDISEDEILKYDKVLFEILLADRTTGRNIIWGTSDYEHLGEKYKAQSQIMVELVTGENNNVIQPRIYKEKNSQTNRTKDKAEVFTPSWMCNEQNNLIDKAWFGREDVFNIRVDKKWTSTVEPIKFDNVSGKQWSDYIDAKRLEIACGEAPYLVSRYDTVTGEPIRITDRVGLLDRKLRVVGENTNSENDWLEWTRRAYQSIYGFEFQGDNLMLARENLLYTFIDYYSYRFKRKPSITELSPIAEIISWNLWQMDGIRFTVPCSESREQYGKDESNSCYCKIRDWQTNETVTYASLIESGGGKGFYGV
jgi:hypothetical protein